MNNRNVSHVAEAVPLACSSFRMPRILTPRISESGFRHSSGAEHLHLQFKIQENLVEWLEKCDACLSECYFLRILRALEFDVLLAPLQREPANSPCNLVQIPDHLCWNVAGRKECSSFCSCSVLPDTLSQFHCQSFVRNMEK